jgi:hypothetical protein
MDMKQEDEDNHKSEVFNIKIEVPNDGEEEEVKKTMEITEKIKRVIEKSFGEKDYEDTAVAEDISVKMEINGAESASTLKDFDNVIKKDHPIMSNDDYDDIADSESDHESFELEELADTATNKSEEDLKEMEEKLKVFAKEMKKVKTLPMPGSRKSDFKENIRNSFAELLPPQMLTRLTPNSVTRTSPVSAMPGSTTLGLTTRGLSGTSSTAPTRTTPPSTTWCWTPSISINQSRLRKNKSLIILRRNILLVKMTSAQ